MPAMRSGECGCSTQAQKLQDSRAGNPATLNRGRQAAAPERPSFPWTWVGGCSLPSMPTMLGDACACMYEAFSAAKRLVGA